MDMLENLVPEQVTGTKTGATSKIKAPSIQAAKHVFDEAKKRLLDVNRWYTICGEKGAEFSLTDETGTLLPAEKAAVGLLIRIALPAPGNATGHGYDWVRIEELAERNDEEGSGGMCGFRVRPVSNPQTRSEESAHFYTSEATSSFIVLRNGITVFALERGRNEKPNPAGGLLNKLRNAVVALAAMAGFSTPQWKLLTSALLAPKNKC